MASAIEDLTADFQAFVTERLMSGRYADAHEVLQAAKQALLREEADADVDVDYLRRALDEAESSGRYDGDVFLDLRKKYHLLPRA